MSARKNNPLYELKRDVNGNKYWARKNVLVNRSLLVEKTMFDDAYAEALEADDAYMRFAFTDEQWEQLVETVFEFFGGETADILRSKDLRHAYDHVDGDSSDIEGIVDRINVLHQVR